MVSIINPKSPNGAIISDDKLKQILDDDHQFKLFTIQQLERINAKISYIQTIFSYMFIILLILIIISNPHIEQILQSAIQLLH